MASSIEERIRKGLPVIRFFQNIARPSAANRLLRSAVEHTRLPEDVTRESVSADGVKCESIIPRDAAAGRLLVYLHGGGFVFGLSPQHMKLAVYLARKMKVRILLVDYRLAPAFPFPAALDDCVAVYRWALGRGMAAENIAIAGDSAGGNLTITTMMRLRDRGEPLPAAAVCLSPVVSLVPGSNRLKGMRDPVLPQRVLDYYTTSYLGTQDPADPLVSPLFGDLRGLPPLLIHVGECEVLRDNAVRLAISAKEAGVAVRYEVYPRMWHVWQLFQELPQALQSLDDIAEFIGGCYPKPSS